MNVTAEHVDEPNRASGMRSTRLAERSYLLIVPATFGVALLVAYRPSFDTPEDVALAAMPWIAAAGMIAAFAGLVTSVPPAVRVVGTAVAVAAWSVLMMSDDRWSILSFGIYAVCYTAWSDHPQVGLALSGVASAVWVAAALSADGAAWTAIIPICVFVVGAALSMWIRRAESQNLELRRLLRELEQTQLELSASERSKGVLEERARRAGEIHDTLAQGFTSIVLLSRAAQRSGGEVAGDAAVLASIEATAQENLDASRRLIDAMRPPELETDSLQEALRRQMSSGEFRVVGTPRPLPGAVEVTILRAAQELTTNAVAHAEADRVDVTLSYLDDSVALDVADDGVGFTPGTVADRGDLTGGQGLQALERRVESLEGRLTIESAHQQGSVLSVIIPARAT